MARFQFKQQLTNSFGHYKWLIHLVFWMLLLGMSFMQLLQTMKSATEVVKQAQIYAFFTKTVVLLSLSYSFQFLIVPLYSHKRKYLFWVIFLGAVALAFIIRILIIKWLTHDLPGAELDLLQIAYKSVSTFLFPFTFFIAMYYFLDIYDQQKEIQRLIQFKTQKIALESNFLKSQVNPHFLFNTLNNIYALSLRKSAQTAVIIDKLESLLHYMLYDCKADLVPLQNEFTFTNSYIALEKLRHKEDQCVVTVTTKGDISGKMIAPLLLINFLENAFKHGTKTSFGKSWINLDIEVTDDLMHFRLQNSKPLSAIGQSIQDYQGGIGLKNVERRLQILYPERHSLQMNSLKDRFEIDLTINIQS
ncbi:MAG: sensor histidine kinase [Bacteroidota bacterium]